MSIQKFINHAKLALVDDAAAYTGLGREHKKNILETAGNAVLSPIRHIPIYADKFARWGYHFSYDAAHNPKVITVGLTGIAMVGVAFAFYPTFMVAKTQIAIEAAKKALLVVAEYLPDLETVKDKAWLGTFLTIETGVMSFGTRTLGRVSNEKLMEAFYKNDQKQAKVVHQQ